MELLPVVASQSFQGYVSSGMMAPTQGLYTCLYLRQFVRLIARKFKLDCSRSSMPYISRCAQALECIGCAPTVFFHRFLHDFNCIP